MTVSALCAPVTPTASVTAVSGGRRSCSAAVSAGMRSTAIKPVSAPAGKSTSRSVVLSRATAKCPTKTCGKRRFTSSGYQCTFNMLRPESISRVRWCFPEVVFLLCFKSTFQVSVLYQCFSLENFTSQYYKA